MKHRRRSVHRFEPRDRRRRSIGQLCGGCLGAMALTLVSGCGPVTLVATSNIPTPLIVKIPVGVALFMPKEFSQYVHEEERWSTTWHVELGQAQAEGISRLMSSIFETVVPVDSLSIGADGKMGAGIRAILEPSIEEYAFVTPRDAGSPFFAVSIKYRVNVYLPDGKLADSWGFTGYGTSPAQGLSSVAPLATATSLAMRDAGAKLAVEFREQAVVRGLLPQSVSADEADASQPAGDPSLPGAAQEQAVETPRPGNGSALDGQAPGDDSSPASQDDAAQASDKPGTEPPESETDPATAPGTGTFPPAADPPASGEPESES